MLLNKGYQEFPWPPSPDISNWDLGCILKIDFNPYSTQLYAKAPQRKWDEHSRFIYMGHQEGDKDLIVTIALDTFTKEAHFSFRFMKV